MHASQFHDFGVNALFNHLLDALGSRFDRSWAEQAERLQAGAPNGIS